MVDTFIHGIDVSHHNGSIDWAKVATDGQKFAYIKATEGTGFTDSKLAANWSGAGQNGIVRGAYHFFKPSKSGTDQADHFLNHVSLKKGDLIPVVDVESFDGSSVTKFLKELKIYLDAVEARVDAKPSIYTFKAFWRDTLGNPTNFSDYPLWIVDLSAPTNPRLPSGWPDYAIWQHSFEGIVKGIHGMTDLDRIKGGEAGLNALRLP